jgi:CubicO group peptidase (beta-lactamase class C family)
MPARRILAASSLPRTWLCRPGSPDATAVSPSSLTKFRNSRGFQPYVHLLHQTTGKRTPVLAADKPMNRPTTGVAQFSLRLVALGLSFAQAPSTAADVAANAKHQDAAHGPVISERIERIENGFDPIPVSGEGAPLHLDIKKLMKLFNVPGLSVAVIDDYKIAWAKGYGVTGIGASTAVTTHTLFQAGSLSKPVAAAGALYLVQTGKLSLDEDVNQKLVSWKVSENEYTTQQKVTLRRIMSHSAGMTVHGFPGYDVSEPRPTLLQILDGERPANTAPVRVTVVPGTEWHYSGGGVLVEQQLIVDVTHATFPQFMHDVVFTKLNMQESSYEQPLPPERAAAAARGTLLDGRPVPGGWHIYPEMAAAGLWTTPSDLAKFSIEIALAKKGNAKHLLSRAMATEMLSPQMPRVAENTWGDDEHPDRMGLGFFLGDAERPDRFGHVGDDEGFQAMMIMFGDSGQGAVIMANSQQGIRVGRFLLNNIAMEYGWNYVPPQGRIGANTALIAVAQLRSTQAAIDTYEGLRKSDNPTLKIDQNTLVNLGYNLATANKLQDAIRSMQLAVQEYPNNWNAYDSLAEMYAKAGDKQKAIANYTKSIELNPDNAGGRNALRKLQAQ